MAFSRDFVSTVSTKGRVELTAEIVAAWNESRLSYAIMHGIDEYPAAVGRDLDILVEPNDEERLLSVAREILLKNGWQVVRPVNTWGERIVAFSGNNGLELHTVRKLSWREIVFSTRPEPQSSVDFFPRDPWATYVKQILMPGFRGDSDKVRSNLALLDLNESERNLIRIRLSAMVTARARATAMSIPDRPADDVIAALPGLRSAMVKRVWQHEPLLGLCSFGGKIKQRLKALAVPTGVSIEVRTLPAEGENLIQQLRATDKSVFTQFAFRASPTHGGTGGSVIADALKRLWWRTVADRPVLGGQGVVFHIRPLDQPAERVPVISRLVRFLDRIGRQPVATVMAAESEPDRAERPAQLAGNGVTTIEQIVGVAISAFVNAHDHRHAG